MGDFDGDGRDDLLCHDPAAGKLWVDLADASGRFYGSDWSSDPDFCMASQGRIQVADSNGDGRDDVLCYDAASGVLRELFGRVGEGLSQTPEGTARVHLRTFNQVHYVVAEQGGGGAVNASRTVPRTWETFTLVDLNGGLLMNGDQVQLRTWDDEHYVVAESGGGDVVRANRTRGLGWETFTIEKSAGGVGRIGFGDAIHLKTYNGRYVIAEGGGGGVVSARRNQALWWEAFTLMEAP